MFFKPCPMFSPWSEWSDCDATCGPSLMIRSRECMNGEVGMDGCIGAIREVDICDTEVSLELVNHSTVS